MSIKKIASISFESLMRDVFDSKDDVSGDIVTVLIAFLSICDFCSFLKQNKDEFLLLPKNKIKILLIFLIWKKTKNEFEEVSDEYLEFKATFKAFKQFVELIFG